MSETKNNHDIPVLLTVPQFAKRHPAFTAGGLRHLLFADPEGFRAACVARFGRRLLIDEGAFFAWLRRNRLRTNLRADPAPKATPEATPTPTPEPTPKVETPARAARSAS